MHQAKGVPGPSQRGTLPHRACHLHSCPCPATTNMPSAPADTGQRLGVRLTTKARCAPHSTGRVGQLTREPCCRLSGASDPLTCTAVAEPGTYTKQLYQLMSRVCWQSSHMLGLQLLVLAVCHRRIACMSTFCVVRSQMPPVSAACSLPGLAASFSSCCSLSQLDCSGSSTHTGVMHQMMHELRTSLAERLVSHPAQGEEGLDQVLHAHLAIQPPHEVLKPTADGGLALSLIRQDTTAGSLSLSLSLSSFPTGKAAARRLPSCSQCTNGLCICGSKPAPVQR